MLAKNNTSSAASGTCNTITLRTCNTGITCNTIPVSDGMVVGRGTRECYNILARYLREDEISEILDNVKFRIGSGNNDYYISILKTFLDSERHFSEEFLLNHLDKNNISKLKESVLKAHYYDIKSGEYSQLALLFELNDK